MSPFAIPPLANYISQDPFWRSLFIPSLLLQGRRGRGGGERVSLHESGGWCFGKGRADEEQRPLLGWEARRAAASGRARGARAEGARRAGLLRRPPATPSRAPPKRASEPPASATLGTPPSQPHPHPPAQRSRVEADTPAALPSAQGVPKRRSAFGSPIPVPPPPLPAGRGRESERRPARS